MTQSKQRAYNRSLKQAKANNSQSKIINRYLAKQEEYKKLSKEELDSLAESIQNRVVKLSKTDLQAFYDVYKPILIKEAIEQYKNKQKELKTQENESKPEEIQTD